ncbi:hypothetical protein SY86_05885 [Erwinia tracheiphila]|uniref:Uncharacterized protein n=1 Tax=Erwinia tracheiphila TaxID=65700 RepID=A0A0M2KCT2_9GAMM|nr:hypothetical protein SY86_05885 [Erwinia tracheiphila]
MDSARIYWLPCGASVSSDEIATAAAVLYMVQRGACYTRLKLQTPVFGMLASEVRNYYLSTNIFESQMLPHRPCAGHADFFSGSHWP